MLDGKDLEIALNNLTPGPWTGVAYRLIPAQDPQATNLVIFPGRLRSGSQVRVYDDSGLIDATLLAR